MALTCELATAFNQPIGGWNVASVANMYGTFYSASAFNHNIAAWNVLRVTTAGWVTTWTSATALSDCNEKAVHAAWGATFQTAWPAFGMVTTCTLSSLCVACITNSNIAASVALWMTDPTCAATTYGNIADWNTAAVTTMYRVFYTQTTFNDDIGKWNTASVSNYASAFYSASTFNRDVSTWNVASATTMYRVFFSAAAFNQNIAAWNVAAVANMNGFLRSAKAFAQNMATWNVASVSDMVRPQNSSRSLGCTL
jgi:hypothetical protein